MEIKSKFYDFTERLRVQMWKGMKIIREELSIAVAETKHSKTYTQKNDITWDALLSAKIQSNHSQKYSRQNACDKKQTSLPMRQRLAVRIMSSDSFSRRSMTPSWPAAEPCTFPCQTSEDSRAGQVRGRNTPPQFFDPPLDWHLGSGRKIFFAAGRMQGNIRRPP